MFRKIIAVLSLVAFINLRFSQDVWAAREVELCIDEKGFYQVRFTNLFEKRYSPDNRDLFIHLKNKEGHKLATLTHKNDRIEFKGKQGNFSFADLPELKHIFLKTTGEVNFSNTITVQKKLKINAKKISFYNGFQVQKQGHADFTGEELRLQGNFSTRLLKAKIGKIIHRGTLESGECFLESDSILQGGSINTDLLNVKASEFKNTKVICSKYGQLSISNHMSNTGEIKIHSLIGNGKWHNAKKGSVQAQYFQGNFSTFEDDGSTHITGFFNTKADSGHIAGGFSANCGILSFKHDIFIPNTAHILFNKYFSLHSNGSLEFQGTLDQDSKTLGNSLPQGIENIINQFPVGAYFSANQNLIKGGSLTSINTPIYFSSNGDFEKDGYMRSGFFTNNDINIKANKTDLSGNTTCFNTLRVQSEILKLQDEQQLNHLFFQGKNFIRNQGDKTSLETASVFSETAKLEGDLEIGKQAYFKTDDFETTSANKITGTGALVVDSQNVMLNGKESQDISSIKGKTITKGANYLSEAEYARFDGDTILHQSGSKSHSKTNVEKSKERILLELSLIHI